MSKASFWADARRDTRRFIIEERSVRREIEREQEEYERRERACDELVRISEECGAYAVKE